MKVAAPLSQEGPKRSIECILDISQGIRTPRYWLEGGLSIHVYSFRNSGVYEPYFLVGGSYGDASVLGREHQSFGVLLKTDVFRNSGQGHHRSSGGLFIQQAALRPTRERFKECGSQGVIGDVQARNNPHRTTLCHTLVDWEEGGAVGIAGVSRCSGRNSDNGTSFLGDVVEGGKARGCRFETCERTPVNKEMFRCVRTNGYHQGYL